MHERVKKFLDDAKDEQDRQLRIMILKKRGIDHNESMPEDREMEDDDLKHKSKNTFIFDKNFKNNPLRNIEVPPNTLV